MQCSSTCQQWMHCCVGPCTCYHLQATTYHTRVPCMVPGHDLPYNLQPAACIVYHSPMFLHGCELPCTCCRRQHTIQGMLSNPCSWTPLTVQSTNMHTITCWDWLWQPQYRQFECVSLSRPTMLPCRSLVMTISTLCSTTRLGQPILT